MLGQVLAIADGLLWTRFALPFALNHINFYILEDGDGWAVIDTGVDDERTKEAWTSLLDGPLRGRPIRKLIVTHHHPDHIGLAGWLARRYDIPIHMTESEYLFARHLGQNSLFIDDEAYQRFYRGHGVAPEVADTVILQGRHYPRMVSELPPNYRQIREGESLSIGGRRFEIMSDGGHCSDMAMLLCRDEKLFLAADQVLLDISPNVSVMPINPEGDPLGIYLRSLARLKKVISDDVLVLPGHGRTFERSGARIDELIAHHASRCAIVGEACAAAPRTAAELVRSLFPRALDLHQLSFAFGETLAHVNMMIRDGRLRWISEGGVLRATA
jgi:glyoxylase-like metal-dependent hydrolase (beta-lactamase superfamily II)